MPQFCILFYANYTILATQRGGGHGPMAPPTYAPGQQSARGTFRSSSKATACPPCTAEFHATYARVKVQAGKLLMT